MDERKNRERDMDMGDDLLGEMERNTNIRRATNVRNALGPIEGTEASESAAESALNTEERHSGRSRSRRSERGRSEDEY